MRTHGAKEQHEAVRKVPANQLKPVFEALDTLGSTKWSVNKRGLGFVDRIWNKGGRLADLVDRDDVPLPEQPDTEDEAVIKKWKWKVKSVRKQNKKHLDDIFDSEDKPLEGNRWWLHAEDPLQC